MAELNGFNADDYGEQATFEPIPEGKYLAIVEASEVKTTKDQQGSYLEFRFLVLDGQHKGRKVWSRITHKNKSPEATAIGGTQLAALCRAVGVLRPRDTVELHDKPLCISVKLEKRKDTGAITNKIVGYFPRAELAKQAAPVQQAQPAPQPVGAGAPAGARTTAPWARG